MLTGQIALVFVAVWLASTLVFQFASLSRRHPALDRLGILPRWLFFTQGVGASMLAVEVRRRSLDGQFGDWVRVPLWPPRRWWHALFYPEQFRAGLLWTALDRVARRAERGDPAAVIAGSQAHATLLAYLRPFGSGDAWQFAVLRVVAADTAASPAILFISQVHP